jgi:hypothetical protein
MVGTAAAPPTARECGTASLLPDASCIGLGVSLKIAQRFNAGKHRVIKVIQSHRDERSAIERMRFFRPLKGLRIPFAFETQR